MLIYTRMYFYFRLTALRTGAGPGRNLANQENINPRNERHAQWVYAHTDLAVVGGMGRLLIRRRPIVLTSE